jgi:hypothetical protein
MCSYDFSGPIDQGTVRRSPEDRLSDALRKELGLQVNAQALRIFIRTHWTLVSKAAHEIHDS